MGGIGMNEGMIGFDHPHHFIYLIDVHSCTLVCNLMEQGCLALPLVYLSIWNGRRPAFA